MPGKPELIYWDANVFLTWLKGGPEERLPFVQAVLEDVDGQEKKIVTSILSKVEVAYVEPCGSQGIDPNLQSVIDDMWEDRSRFVVVEFHEDIALMARDLVRQAKMKGFSLRASDAIHLASAEWVHVASFQTYDKDILKCAQGLQEILGFPVEEPWSAKPRLPL